MIEGTDASGKGVGKRYLKEYLEDKLKCNIVMTHEPTKEDIGHFIRENIKNKTFDSETEALLFAADRRHHCENCIRPEIEKGNVVITERYLYSSLAYQSTQGFNDINWLLEVNAQAMVPDLVIFVYSDIETTMRRINSSLRRSEGITEYFENKELQEKILISYFDIFERFKRRGPKNKFFKPRLIIVNNEGSMIQYQQELKKEIRHFLSRRKVPKCMLKRKSSRYKRFDDLPVNTDFTKEDVLKDFLMNTLEFSFRWMCHPENLPRTFVSRTLVDIVKIFTDYDLVIHKTVKQLHSEIDIQIGYELNSFRRIIRGFRDIQLIETPGVKRRKNYFIGREDISDPDMFEYMIVRYVERLRRYRKDRPRYRKMVISDYLYQLSVFISKYKSPLLYAFIMEYVYKKSDKDPDSYVIDWINTKFTGIN